MGSLSLLQGISQPRIKPGSPALQADSLLSEPPGKPRFGVLALYCIYNSNYFLTFSRFLFNFVVVVCVFFTVQKLFIFYLFYYYYFFYFTILYWFCHTST